MPSEKDFNKEDLKSLLWFLLELNLAQRTISGRLLSQVRVLEAAPDDVFWDATVVHLGLLNSSGAIFLNLYLINKLFPSICKLVE